MAEEGGVAAAGPGEAIEARKPAANGRATR